MIAESGGQSGAAVLSPAASTETRRRKRRRRTGEASGSVALWHHADVFQGRSIQCDGLVTATGTGSWLASKHATVAHNQATERPSDAPSSQSSTVVTPRG